MAGESGQTARPPDPPPDPPPGPLLRLVRDRRVAFLLVGGVNTLFGYGCFAFFEALLGAPLNRVLGAGLAADVVLLPAHVVSVLVAFVLYRRFVFRVRGQVLTDLVRFESVYLVAIGVNLAVLPVLVGVVRIPPLPAQALVVVVTTLISYFGHREFSFRRADAVPTAHGEAAAREAGAD